MDLYLKRIPVLLSLSFGMFLGMIFLYKKKTLSETFLILIVTIVITYIIGKFVCENLANSYQFYTDAKNKERSLNIKEGTSENLANIDLDSNF